MIIYMENPKESTRKIPNLLELINEFNKFAGYKINIQKSTVLLYTNDKHMNTKIKNTIPFIVMQNKRYTSV